MVYVKCIHRPLYSLYYTCLLGSSVRSMIGYCQPRLPQICCNSKFTVDMSIYRLSLEAIS